MRKLIALIIMALSTAVNAQTVTPIAGDYNYTGNVYFAKGMFIPVRDTIAGYVYRVGAQSIRPADTVGHPLTVPVYVWTGRRWFNIAGGGGNAYTAGNGLSLTGSQFRLGGTLDATTTISTAGNEFSLNVGQADRNTLYLGPTGENVRIGHNNPDGSFGGYEYFADYGRGRHLFYTKGFQIASIDYTGLQMQDSTGAEKVNINTGGTVLLRQDNGNPYLEAASNKLLLSSESDTAFYVDNTRAQFRALANSDETKVVSADEFGALKLVTSPGANTIYSGDGNISGERSITGNSDNGVTWNGFNAYSLNLNDGAGSFGSYGFYPYGFQYSWNPDGEPTSGVSYNGNAYSVSLATSAGFNVNTQENAQIGLGYSIYERATGGVSSNQKIEIQQGFQSDSNLYTIRHYKTNVTSDPGILFGIDTLGGLRFKKYRNNPAGDSVLTVDYTGHMKLKYIPTGGLTTASNGLTVTGSDVKLGGTMDENTTLEGQRIGFTLLNHSDNDNATYNISSAGANSLITQSIEDTALWNGVNEATYFQLDHGSITSSANFTNYENGNATDNVIFAEHKVQYNTIQNNVTSQVLGFGPITNTTASQQATGYVWQWSSNENPGAVFVNVMRFDSTGMGVETFGGDGGAGAEVFKLNEFGKLKLSQYKNSVAGDSVLSTDVDGNVVLKSVDDNFIKNQVSPAQTATNFNIDGTARSANVMTQNAFVSEGLAFGLSLAGKLRTQATNITLDYTEFGILVNNTGTVTVTLPQASNYPGQIFIIKKISAVSNNVIIATTGSETIDGAASKTLTLQNSSVIVMSDGATGWHIMASHAAATTL